MSTLHDKITALLIEEVPTGLDHLFGNQYDSEVRAWAERQAERIGAVLTEATPRPGTTDHFCRSQSPKGDPCERRRGHKGERHWMSEREAKRFGRSTRFWTGGIRTEARWYIEDDGHMSLADEMTWGRILGRR